MDVLFGSCGYDHHTHTQTHKKLFQAIHAWCDKSFSRGLFAWLRITGHGLSYKLHLSTNISIHLKNFWMGIVFITHFHWVLQQRGYAIVVFLADAIAVATTEQGKVNRLNMIWICSFFLSRTLLLSLSILIFLFFFYFMYYFDKYT